MSYLVNGIEAKKVGVLLEPSTYDADITPVDMQRGKTAYVKGEKLTGTGRCFESAVYGSGKVQLLQDENGNDTYGLSILTTIKPNIIFLSSTETGDIILQTAHIVNLENDIPTVIGVNHSASGDVTVTYDNNRLKVYLGDTKNNTTRLRYFLGKDNKI